MSDKPAVEDEPSAPELASYLPYREFFALDLRSLALFRVCLALMLLLDWLDRVPDLHALYSDEGVMPRSMLHGIQPVSIHILSGEVWYQGLLAAAAVVLALMLLVGWKTPLAAFLSFFLLISVHGRNPAVLHGADQMLRAVLFWGIFLPLGAVWSIDSSGANREAKDKAVLSFASFAFIGQLFIVYLFAAAWKWNPEWREKGTAVLLALQVDSFSTRLGKILRESHEACRMLTIGSVWLETVGPAVLLLPFNVGLQRLLVIFAFIGFHAGLGLTLELSLFPWIACAAWLALLPSSFWDRLERHWKTPELDATRIVYDPQRPRAAWTAFAWRSMMLFGAGKVEPAAATAATAGGPVPAAGWAVLGADGVERTGADAVTALVRLSPIFSPLAWLVERSPSVAGFIASLCAGPVSDTPEEEDEGEKAPVEPAWRPPAGPVVSAVVVLTFGYILMFNLRTIGSEYMRPPTEKTVLNHFFEEAIPLQFLQFGLASGLDQGWGVFAPRPARTIGWYNAVATLRDGTQVELMRGTSSPPDLGRPENYQTTFSNGRWRRFIFILGAADLYPAALPGYIQWSVREWNRDHVGDKAMVRLEVYYVREENRSPDQEPDTPTPILLRAWVEPPPAAPAAAAAAPAVEKK